MTTGPAKLARNSESNSETNSKTKLANKLVNKLATKPSYTSIDYGVTLLRLSLGVMWIAHAMLKLLVFTLPGTAEFLSVSDTPVFWRIRCLPLNLAAGSPCCSACTPDR